MTIFTEAQNPASLDGMTNALDLLLLFMLLYVGIYGLYTVIRLRKTYMLFPNRFLYPNGCSAETCLDEGAFIDYIIPRLLIMSISCLLMAIAFAVLIYVFPHIQSWVIDLLTVLLPFSVLLWYGIIQHKVSKIYW